MEKEFEVKKELQEKRKEIETFDDLVEYLKDGGYMVLSTCTINRLENEDNTRDFLNRHKEMRLIEERQIVPVNGENDGFYYALVKKG